MKKFGALLPRVASWRSRLGCEVGRRLALQVIAGRGSLSSPRAGHPRYLVFAGPLMAALLSPPTGWACVACYGQSDSPLAAGMNWGILSLLGFIVCVLGGVAGFFIFLARKSAALKKADAPAAIAKAELSPLQETSETPFVRHSERRPTLADYRQRCRPARVLGMFRRRRSASLPARMRSFRTS